MAQRAVRNRIHRTPLSHALRFLRNLVLILFAAITLYPFLNVLATSMSDYTAYVRNPTMIIPQRINFNAYRSILRTPLIYTSYRNTLIVTLVGTAVNVVLTTLLAYPLSKPYLRGNRIVMALVVFTMMFNGGMIPNYIVIRQLGLINSYGALFLPGAVSAYNMILMKNFFAGIPDSMEESAHIDGATDIRILWSIIIPLSLPSIASIALFYAVGNWNIYLRAVLYTTRRDMWTLQLLLRELILNASSTVNQDAAEVGQIVYTQTLITAAIVVTVLPILAVYPFLQRYFVQGVMVGAVKG